jgi:hypothetical protein
MSGGGGVQERFAWACCHERTDRLGAVPRVSDLVMPVSEYYHYRMTKETGSLPQPPSEFWHARHSCGHAVY